MCPGTIHLQEALYSYHYIAGVASKEFSLSKKAAGCHPAAFIA
ncbi:hypothetical protein CHCC14814_3849 [Bacillus paralicheniformis]|nr:hypothetical protein CHCC14814_3849 [Bacillus paralicheniformis]